MCVCACVRVCVCASWCPTLGLNAIFENASLKWGQVKKETGKDKDDESYSYYSDSEEDLPHTGGSELHNL